MDFQALRKQARGYIKSVTSSNQETSSLRETLSLHFEESITLASLIETLDISNYESDRQQTFEKIIVLEAFLAREDNADSGTDQDSASHLVAWVSTAILPSSAFADRSPYSAEEKPVLTPDVIAEEHALSAHGLMLLSHLFKLHLPHYNDESTFPLFTCLASFTDPTDAWTSPQITSQAASLLETFTDPAHLPPLLHNLLTERIKPLFARSKNPAITAQGRKAIDPIPSNDTLHSDLDAENKPWKYRDVYIVTVFRWVLIHLDEKSLEENWPLLIPPLLSLIDDSSTAFKAKGCALLTSFLQKCPPPLLERTGLGEVFENAVTPCLMHLPSLTEEKGSLQILRAAYPALIELANARFAGEKERRAREKALDRILRDGVFKGYAHAGEYVGIAEVLVEQMIALIEGMGIHSAKHLKHILRLLSANLANPFATAYPPLLQASIKAIQVVIVDDWPRISYHRGQILRGLSICWCRILDEEKISKELQDVRKNLKQTLRLLTSVTSRDINAAQEYRTLIDNDTRLQDLLVVQ